MPEGSSAKLIVGLDLQPECHGAIRVAAWLAATSEHSKALVGIHVLENDYLRSALRYHHLQEMIDGARGRANEIVASVGAEEHFSEVEVLRGPAVETSLEVAYNYHAAGGIIIGRHARAEGRHLLRLGRVARRLLRRLPGPTFVVPPDYDPATNADGPVMCTTNMTSSGAGAAAFAARLAVRLGRPLLLVHVVPLPHDYAAHYLPEASLEKMKAEHQSQGETLLAAWAAEHGCNAAERVVLQGGVVEQVVGLAQTRGACAVITGSRRLSTFERLLLTSVGSEIAATAPCPVAVIPPE